ncbi:bifunctional homocysteine S-methyltransferase/methylenetetrahydrofolate reductase [Paenibacillus sp. 598K]|uniref:bifunctional homocysteine S-methyltransferase/methylenetetrahydrofolate reductase n=1 Tax=Paenibacillus sp. 598K TaxID=1117987 RepID=UPI000FFA1C67|nr:bifunctional homocysteine S-methyltransferase/methylenetetrahydrofolate reductase [Paenibacillus sp. 598K]GBF76261.1 bifunctional homocysteine S-methyltransferase/methylenetetrahydrofolate reductase [Paenibacillus sp. 598K]
MKPDLREAVTRSLITGDGAMGTYLYQLGFPVGVSFEEFNTLRPEVIRNVHRAYYEAGARLIETNTFSANYEKLSKYGLEGEVVKLNRAGVQLAREAVGEDAYVVGSIGSIRSGQRKTIRTSELRKAFRTQIAALLESGVDGLIMETFFDLEELLLVLSLVREAGDIPTICQLSAEDVGRTKDGVTLSEAFARLEAAGADVVGLNCRSGPVGILRALDTVQGDIGIPLSVFPNAGIPDYVDGQYTYTAPPEYFGDMARKFADRGARLIGGCCGTTPEHCAAISGALQGYEPQPVEAEAELQSERLEVRSPEGGAGGAQEPPPKEPSLVDLVRQRHTVIVELDPPRDLDIRKFMAGAEALKAVRADALTMADNSLAVTRMSNIALASLLQERTGIRPLVHIACRDRNLIGTQSHMMGLDALGIDHVLAVTGDPARFGDLPGSSSVYDLTSFEMIRMIKQLNEGIAFSGKPLKQRADFVVGAAFNPNVKYLEKAVQRLEKKISSGADYIMTQPVYDPRLIEEIAKATAHLPIPVFLGIMPLASGRNAEYLHNEVPGIQLSDEVRQRMHGLEGEQGRAEGVRIAKELLDSALPHFNGIYLMTPFMFYEMSAELTEYVWVKTGRQQEILRG